MSASIKDISGLIGVLGCDADACARLIEPTEDEGAGERMILPTSLIDPTSKKPEIAAACALLAKQTNVVVLTTSAAQAKAWTNAGAVLSQDKDFNGALEKLRTSIGNYVVFAQRFDGVDLPDDACRILVIDGIPSGERITDQVDSYRQKDSPEYEVRTVNKFEQALGRAVRSSADYAAVLLVGADIAAFIGRKMSPVSWKAEHVCNWSLAANSRKKPVARNQSPESSPRWLKRCSVATRVGRRRTGLKSRLRTNNFAQIP